jgi:hypothetical protein
VGLHERLGDVAAPELAKRVLGPLLNIGNAAGLSAAVASVGVDGAGGEVEDELLDRDTSRGLTIIVTLSAFIG